MNYIDYEKITDNKLFIDFFEKFGGLFSIETPAGEVYYEDMNGEWYETPKTEKKFMDMLLKSIKNNKNLFLDKKYIDNDEII